MPTDQVFKLGVVNSHAIQYFAPLYRRLASDPRIELEVFFCSRQGAEPYLDDQFGRTIQYDVPILEGYPHTFVPNWRKRDELHGFFSLVNPGLVAALRRKPLDAVLINGHNLLATQLALLTAWGSGIPILARGESHLQLPQKTVRGPLRGPLLNYFYAKVCSGHLAIGTRNREFLLAQGVAPEKIFIAPYSVDNEYFSKRAAACEGRVDELRAELGLPLELPLILFASKFMRRKRPDDVLEAFRRLRERGVRAGMVFVGTGEMHDAIVDRAAEQNIPDVHFMGFRNQSELPTFYGICDVFVLPSDGEPWGLIVNEVMSAGMPVVATADVGSIDDLVVHGENGFIYPTGDIDKLTDHLASLVSSPELSTTMGAASRRIIAGWGIEATASGVLAALEWLEGRHR